MSRPRLLDLFSGAGGCSVGYDRAGFEVYLSNLRVAIPNMLMKAMHGENAYNSAPANILNVWPKLTD